MQVRHLVVELEVRVGRDRTLSLRRNADTVAETGLAEEVEDGGLKRTSLSTDITERSSPDSHAQ